MKDQPINTSPEKITLDYHQQHPEVSLERYVRSKVLATADRVLVRKSVYLDTRFWILLRDACLGRGKDSVHQKMLDQLRLLVASGKVICPINANTLVELLKQRDQTTRLATAKLIDELSLGVALQSEAERTGTELMHCVQLSLRGPAALEPLERLVWTSPAYVLGHTFPMLKLHPEDELLAYQKAFTDYFWDFPLADQLSYLQEIPADLNGRWDALADKLNREIKEHDQKALPFGELHLHEFRGGLELYLPTLEKIFSHLYENEIGVSPSEDTRQQFAPQLINLLVEALRTDKIGRQLPTLIIRAGLHAGVRRNRGRQFTGNDLHDFGHATAALAYCDYFATDRSLHHLVVNELKFDQRYETPVVAEPWDLLAMLDQI
ncbi:MAG TPA: hypothetical protein VJ875_16295 [Pyrinomonadaceae bacterium]|nr:hypothetical protein [Pyrinomonadaceae bacterium]